MIKKAKYLLDFYIDASIHVALAVYALCYMFILQNNLPYDESLVYTVFYGSITGYNFVKYAPLANVGLDKLKKGFWVVVLFSLVCLFLLIYYASKLPFRTLGCLFLGLIILLGYIFPFFSKKNLRSVSRLKIFLVAFCWALVVVVAPVYHYNMKLSLQVVFESIQIFILIVALIIPFDIRDLRSDSNFLQTIPQLIGVKKSKQVAYVLLITYLLMDVTMWGWQLYQLTFILLIVAIRKMPSKPIKYYCSLGIESFPILLLLSYLIVI